ncbi:MAG: ribose-phosphate pyrophosphokinase [bacterium]|nr:ribose-phosphate pyrophosphokinase [bacterium]
MNSTLRFLTGRSNTQLAEDIAGNLDMELTGCSIIDFPDGEIHVKIDENVRGRDVFAMQTLSPPVNDNLVELLIMIDALKRASASRITAVIPYFGYARQDRKDQPRVPITAKLIANLLTSAGADRVLTMDLHAGQIQGFCDVPVDNLTAMPILLRYVYDMGLEPLVIASPDIGGVKVARAFALNLEKLQTENGKKPYVGFAVIDKARKGPNEVKAMGIVGDVDGANVFMVDDMVATGGSLAEAAAYIIECGAKSVRAGVSHGILAGKAITKIENSPIEEMIITDSIPHPNGLPEKFNILSIAGIFASAIKAVHKNESVSKLFQISR